MSEASRPEPDELASAIARGLGWGPMNCAAGIRAKFRCEYCGKDMLRSLDAYYSWEIDHVVPGNGDALNNIALSCRTCNHLKHMYRPAGDAREDRIKNAARHIASKLEAKRQELSKLRVILGLSESKPDNECE